jgi:nitrite reductase (NADH) small subunit
MQTYVVGKTSQVTDSSPLIVKVNDITVGVYKLDDKYFAYENECPHEGGPVVEGELFRELIQRGGVEGNSLYGKEDRTLIICPWHGVQYDIRTGSCRVDGSLKLKHVDLIIEDENIVLRL